MNTEELIRELPKALISWYDFCPGAKALFVSGGRPECEVLFEVLKEKRTDIVKAAASDLYEISDTFDYIVAAGVIENSRRPEILLARLRVMLKDSGKLLIGAENRLAIRYFCGDKDTFSGHVLDGIDGYIKLSGQRKEIIGGRAYSKAEYKKMLIHAGFKKFQFYSVMPELARPQILFAEEYIPNESIDIRVFPQYKSPETIFLEEERLYADLMENHMFHQMANGFLIECTSCGELLEASQITVQGDRGHEEAMATIISYPKLVLKKALYPEAVYKIEALRENAQYLKLHDVPMTDGYIENNAYVMPFINGQIATEYFREALKKNRELFVQELEAFRQIILSSSEHVPYEEIDWEKFEPWWEKRKKDDPNIDLWKKRAFGPVEERRNIGVILKRGYIDMVSLNCFRTEKGFIFFDQEFFIENFPANAVFIRTIDFIYRDSPDLEKLFSKAELLKYFNLYEYQGTWRTKGNTFLEKLRNDKELSGYHRQHRRDGQIVLANRHRMDYSQEEYDRLFNNIFKGADYKKIYLFGSGNYAKQFIEQFGKYYEIAGILDNNKDRWGGNVSGIRIGTPDCLREIREPFKVFICIKYFEEVLSQLKGMDVKDISVYDPRLEYERPLKIAVRQEDAKPKKYHVGYIAGVFDLFHIGHLNVLRRAKEQCDYLIVGVVSDEQVIKSKKTRPYIPFQERLEILEACRYVDEAVEIPADRPNTEDAYYMYHFDVQFSGSDYADDPSWLARKVFLQQHGADMVFFPYTQTTNSTEIKERISTARTGSRKEE